MSSAAPRGLVAQTLTLQTTQPTSLNPALGPIGEPGAIYIYLAYGALIYQRQDGTFVPDLAATWGYAAGSQDKNFSLTLRPNLKFTDGSALDARSVVNSLEYYKSAHGPHSFLLTAMTSAKATSELTVELTFTEPTPGLPFLLSQSQGLGAIIGPRGLANPNSLSDQSDGAGPYSIEPSGILADNQYTYVANPTYWNQDALHYRRIVVKNISDPNTILSSLESGQLDAALQDVSASAVPAAKAAGLQVVASPFSIAGLILADRAGTISPLGNVKVRQAINFAMDRRSLAKLISGADATQTDQISVPGAAGYSTSAADAYPYDITKARALLTDAGYSKGFTLPVLDVAASDPNALIGQAIASALAPLGITVKLTVEPTFGQFIPAALSRKYPAVVAPTPFYGSVGYYYAAKLATSSWWNPFASTDPSLTSLFSQAASADEAQQQSLFQRISERTTQLAWFVPLAVQDLNFIVSRKIDGVQPIELAAAGIINPVGPQRSLSWYTRT